MSKTFKSAGNPCASISIAPSADGVRTVHMHGIESTGVTVSTADAPALSLAILEAAGYEERQKGWDVLNSADENFAQAMRCLSKGLELQERATAEAEAQAELEAEAFKLYIAYMAIHEPMNAIGDWHMLAEHTKEKWLAVARRARELNKENQ